MKHRFTRFQRIAILWFAVFTVLCIANSFLVTAFVRSGEDAFAAMFLPPFIHLGLIAVSVIVYSAVRSAGVMSDDERYIKENHPEIWKKLRPLGEGSRNTFAAWAFLAGGFDDGTDERLNDIKRSSSINLFLMLYAFVLTPAVWILNVFLMTLHGRWGS